VAEALQERDILRFRMLSDHRHLQVSAEAVRAG
jgi:hypothetical protein